MSVPFKNVTVTAYPVEQGSAGDGTLDNPATTTGRVGIQGYLEQWDATEFYRVYDIALQSPGIFQVDVPNAQYFPPDAQFIVTAAKGTGTYLNSSWKVHGRGDVHDDGLQTDHASFLIDQLTFPLGAS